MKAARINKFGHVDSVQVTDVPQPSFKEGQVMVRVSASSINPVDTSLREGEMMRFGPLNPPLTLGFDLSGVVEAVGSGVSRFKAGDEVYGQASVLAGGSGAFAEYATTRADLLGIMPNNLSYVEAASLVLTGTSAVEAIFDHFKLATGQRILIHGAAGGIGSVAVQISKHIGAETIGTATGDGVDFATNLGCDQCIDYREQAFDEIVNDCDFVLDTVGGDTYFRSFRVLKRGGMILSMCEPPNGESMRKYGVSAVFLLTSVNTESLNALRELVEKGIVTPHVERIYSLNEIQKAFEAKERGHVHGKIGVALML